MPRMWKRSLKLPEEDILVQKAQKWQRSKYRYPDTRMLCHTYSERDSRLSEHGCSTFTPKIRKFRLECKWED